jgi:hypothetical protein
VANFGRHRPASPGAGAARPFRALKDAVGWWGKCDALESLLPPVSGPLVAVPLTALRASAESIPGKSGNLVGAELTLAQLPNLGTPLTSVKMVSVGICQNGFTKAWSE